MIERLLAAEAALDDDRWEDAEKAFRQVADADPRSAIARVGLARVAIALGRLDDARPLLQQALALDPDDAVAGRLLAELDLRHPAHDAGAVGAAPTAVPAATESEPPSPLGPRPVPPSPDGMPHPRKSLLGRLLGRGR